MTSFDDLVRTFIKLSRKTIHAISGRTALALHGTCRIMFRWHLWAGHLHTAHTAL